MSTLEQRLEEEPAPQGWTSYLTWPVLLSIGWLIWELTHKPALGAMAVCVKFGLNDYLTARWLSRIDGDRARGHSCFWLYLSSGLYKTAITGSILAIAITVLAAVLKPRGLQPQAPILDWQGLREAFLGAALTTVGGFMLSVLMSHLALVWAMRYKVKLWLDHEIHQARRKNTWPTCFPAAGRANRAEFPIIVSLVFSLGFVTLGTLIATTILFRNFGGWAFLTGMGLALMVFATGLRWFFRGTEHLRRAVFARTPEECWGVPEYDEA